MNGPFVVLHVFLSDLDNLLEIVCGNRLCLWLFLFVPCIVSGVVFVYRGVADVPVTTNLSRQHLLADNMPNPWIYYPK